MDIQFIDYSRQVLMAMHEAEIAALTAIGLAAVEVTTDYMQSRYGKPIRITGDLMRDVNFRVNTDEKETDIGNSLEYAPWVHNGTARLTSRPYLNDAIIENPDIWKEIAADFISRAMK